MSTVTVFYPGSITSSIVKQIISIVRDNLPSVSDADILSDRAIFYTSREPTTLEEIEVDFELNPLVVGEARLDCFVTFNQ